MSSMNPSSTGAVANPAAQEQKLSLAEHAVVLVIVCAIALIANWAGQGTALLTALPGMLIIYAIVMAGLLLTKVMPFYLPSVAWVSLVSMAVTLPITPGSEWLLGHLKAINFLSMVTPVLAYAGLAISRQEVSIFKASGIKIVLVSLLVFAGTYLGSAVIAQLML